MKRRKQRSSGASLVGILFQLLPGALVVAVFAAIGVMHVVSRVQVVDSGYRLSQLEQESQLLALENDRLKLELATLKNPARLEKEARTRLGLGPPAVGTVVALGKRTEVSSLAPGGSTSAASTPKQQKRSSEAEVGVLPDQSEIPGARGAGESAPRSLSRPVALLERGH
jgi:cell division protein FtsL